MGASTSAPGRVIAPAGPQPRTTHATGRGGGGGGGGGGSGSPPGPRAGIRGTCLFTGSVSALADGALIGPLTDCSIIFPSDTPSDIVMSAASSLSTQPTCSGSCPPPLYNSLPPPLFLTHSRSDGGGRRRRPSSGLCDLYLVAALRVCLNLFCLPALIFHLNGVGEGK